MIKNIFFTFSLLIFPALLSAQDYRSTEFEKRMNDIYHSSYGEIPDEEWAQHTRSLNQRSYIIAEGDTLWDLSEIFFGEGNLWSKVWSYNRTLTNPHMLTVGRKINFFAGSLDEAPGVSVESDEGFDEEEELDIAGLPKGFKIVKTETGESAITKVTDPDEPQPQKTIEVVATKTLLYPDAPAIPPPSILPKKILKKIPKTFEESYSFDASQYDEKGISFDLRPPVRVNPLFVAHSFLYAGKAVNYPNVGRLVETEDNVILVGQNQKVYIKSDQKLEIGERLTVMGRDYKFDRNSFVGDVIRYMGTVEINEILPDNYFRGTLIRSLSGIKGNPWVSREIIPAFEDDYAGRPSNLKFKVIGGGQDNVTRVFGQSDVIYLGGGANQGLRVPPVANRTMPIASTIAMCRSRC